MRIICKQTSRHSMIYLHGMYPLGCTQMLMSQTMELLPVSKIHTSYFEPTDIPLGVCEVIIVFCIDKRPFLSIVGIIEVVSSVIRVVANLKLLLGRCYCFL